MHLSDKVQGSACISFDGKGEVMVLDASILRVVGCEKICISCCMSFFETWLDRPGLWGKINLWFVAVWGLPMSSGHNMFVCMRRSDRKALHQICQDCPCDAISCAEMQRLGIDGDSDTYYSMITRKDESVTKKESMTKKEWGNDQSKRREAKQFLYYKKTRIINGVIISIGPGVNYKVVFSQACVAFTALMLCKLI